MGTIPDSFGRKSGSCAAFSAEQFYSTRRGGGGHRDWFLRSTIGYWRTDLPSTTAAHRLAHIKPNARLAAQAGALDRLEAQMIRLFALCPCRRGATSISNGNKPVSATKSETDCDTCSSCASRLRERDTERTTDGIGSCWDSRLIMVFVWARSMTWTNVDMAARARWLTIGPKNGVTTHVGD